MEAKKLIQKLLDDAKPHPLLIRLAWHDSGTYDKVLNRLPAVQHMHVSVEASQQATKDADSNLSIAAAAVG